MDYGLMAIVALTAYLLGSVNFSIVVSGLFHRVDIRDYGSGNAGSTNAYRVMGKKWALVVLLGDIGKALLAVQIGAWTMGPGGEEALGKLLCGLFVIIGHIFPVFFGFRGGKGIITAAATIAMIDYRVFLIVFGLFLVVFFISRWVSLGSVLGVGCVPVCMYFLHPDEGQTTVFMVALSCVFTFLIIFMHRENIRRIFKGEEKRFSFRGRAVLETIKEKTVTIKEKTATSLHHTSQKIHDTTQKIHNTTNKIQKATSEKLHRAASAKRYPNRTKRRRRERQRRRHSRAQ